MSSPIPAYGDPKTRERILAVAESLLVEEGRGLRLGEVAKRAGVSRQALYLHFGDRSGLILALVRQIDEKLELADRLAHVRAADTGSELLRRAMRLNTEFWTQVAPVAAVLSRSEGEDDALYAAWRDRMRYRREAFGGMAAELADRGHLAPGWTAEDVADLLYATTHFDSWSELTKELDWGDDRYVEAMSRFLGDAILA